MPIEPKDVKVGAIFITSTNQLRKVDFIKQDNNEIRVHYISKSANFKNRKFQGGPTNKNPPLMDKFITDCKEILSPAQITQFRRKGIILSDE